MRAAKLSQKTRLRLWLLLNFVASLAGLAYSVDGALGSAGPPADLAGVLNHVSGRPVSC